jgi:VanZ family protein
MKRNVKWALLILWVVIIFVLTGFPLLEAPKIKHFPEDKLYHFIVFFIMGFLSAKLLTVKGFFLLGISVLLLAEFQQLIIPGRDFEVLDIVAGGTALVVSYFVCRPKGVKGDVSEA